MIGRGDIGEGEEEDEEEDEDQVKKQLGNKVKVVLCSGNKDKQEYD